MDRDIERLVRANQQCQTAPADSVSLLKDRKCAGVLTIIYVPFRGSLCGYLCCSRASWSTTRRSLLRVCVCVPVRVSVHSCCPAVFQYVLTALLELMFLMELLSVAVP